MSFWQLEPQRDYLNSKEETHREGQMRKHCSSNSSEEVTIGEIRARERRSLATVPSEKNHLTSHTEEGAAEPQNYSGNFLKLISFHTEMNKIWQNQLCYNMVHLGGCELFIPEYVPVRYIYSLTF